MYLVLCLNQSDLFLVLGFLGSVLNNSLSLRLRRAYGRFCLLLAVADTQLEKDKARNSCADHKSDDRRYNYCCCWHANSTSL